MSIERILRGGKFKKLLEKTMADAKNKTNLNRVELEVIYLLFHYDDVTTLTDICQYINNKTTIAKNKITTAIVNTFIKSIIFFPPWYINKFYSSFV